MSGLVTIDPEYLDVLLSFAKNGDVGLSQRRARNWFRKRPVCSSLEGREPGCFSCQAFDAAEQALSGEQDQVQR